MSPHTPGLSAGSHSSPTGQCPRRHKCLPCSNQLPQTTQNIRLTQSYLLHKTLSVQQTKERLYRESWGAVGALRGTWEFSRPEELMSAIVYIPLHLHRVSEGPIQVLWTTCKVAVVHPGHITRAHFSHEQKEQTGSPGHYYMHLASTL